MGFSTHNKAGEITYRKLAGLTYEITITTYTSPLSADADRCELPISWGDGKIDTLPRINGGAGSKCNHSGEVIGKVQINKYVGSHTYPGNGKYVITMEDPNRIENIKNIPNSVGVPFFLKTTLIIHPSLGANSSPVLTFPPLDEACACKGFYHNPGAIDPNGDSISYALSVCYGAGGIPVNGYSFPIAVCNKKIFSLDEKTGTLTWDAPQETGIYNVCISIIEWRKRKFVTGKTIWDTIGVVLRDMQIEVAICNNNPPEFLVTNDVCAIAGDTIEEAITAYDIDVGDNIELTGTGDPIATRNSPAIFRQPIISKDTVRSTLFWATQCSHVKQEDYTMTFKAKDNDTPISLTNFSSLDIRIIGPKVKNMGILAGKNKMTVQWDPAFCANVIGYDIYRKTDSTIWTPAKCETGIPNFLGFVNIGSTSGHGNTIFEDNNNGVGLFHGLIYCYRIVAKFSDGALSIASEEVCSKLPFNTPIITRNSVDITDVSSSNDSISFAKPVVINFSIYTPPYNYKVYSISSSGSELVHTSTSYNKWNDIDTVLEISGLNTEENQYTYKFELFSGTDQIGESHNASSSFLKIGPDDKRLHLTWSQNVPWANFKYVIFKEISGVFSSIDTVSEPPYIDTALVNLKEYRYYVKGLGRYSIEQLQDTLINNSQIVIGIPKDTIPPCPPAKPSIKSECKLYRNQLSWTSPNDSCFYKDAIRYKLYFTPTIGGGYQLIREFWDINDTSVLFDDLESVAGCYGISAIDTFDNESDLSVRVCVDNCPYYELPNVFTPGRDGANDVFHPILPYRYVKNIDLIIWNRWGQVMFKTTDPDIGWDGKRMGTQNQVSSGVYFYTCVINEIRLSGIVPRELKGYITVLNEENFVPKE